MTTVRDLAWRGLPLELGLTVWMHIHGGDGSDVVLGNQALVLPLEDGVIGVKGDQAVPFHVVRCQPESRSQGGPCL